MTNDPIVFQMSVVKNKPQSYRKDKNKDICPFCDVENLTDIYARMETLFGFIINFQRCVIHCRPF